MLSRCDGFAVTGDTLCIKLSLSLFLPQGGFGVMFEGYLYIPALDRYPLVLILSHFIPFHFISYLLQQFADRYKTSWADHHHCLKAAFKNPEILQKCAVSYGTFSSFQTPLSFS